MSGPLRITKHARLMAIVDRWKELHDEKYVRLPVLSAWAIKQGLYPVPGRNCSLNEALAWDRRLQEATS